MYEPAEQAEWVEREVPARMHTICSLWPLSCHFITLCSANAVFGGSSQRLLFCLIISQCFFIRGQGGWIILPEMAGRRHPPGGREPVQLLCSLLWTAPRHPTFTVIIAIWQPTLAHLAKTKFYWMSTLCNTRWWAGGFESKLQLLIRHLTLGKLAKFSVSQLNTY